MRNTLKVPEEEIFSTREKDIQPTFYFVADLEQKGTFTFVNEKHVLRNVMVSRLPVGLLPVEVQVIYW